jgi:hypothetical protein
MDAVVTAEPWIPEPPPEDPRRLELLAELELERGLLEGLEHHRRTAHDAGLGTPAVDRMIADVRADIAELETELGIRHEGNSHADH